MGNLFNIKSLTLPVLMMAFLVPILCAAPPSDASGLLGQEKKLLGITKNNWVHFRDYNGRQLIYFTHLEVYRCGLKQVKYSLNSGVLDKEWVLDPCDLKKPHEINVTPDNLPYISLPLGTAKSISIQLTFKDGSKSEIVTLKP